MLLSVMIDALVHQNCTLNGQKCNVKMNKKPPVSRYLVVELGGSGCF
ncbi:hypothetical protein AOR13_3588 [Alteromonas stellipolaris LMG 21856]|nr:hypothetical protein AOR13_3588 [Alteromonas stellipolaris LMG 21856]